MKPFTLFASLMLALLVAGCASTHSHAMGCGKCSCKQMQAAAADAHKCAMCGHSSTDHTKQATASEHKH